jgi:DNA adenine methylase
MDVVPREVRNPNSWRRPAPPAADRPTPFLKWAGGKTQLLPYLERFFPAAIPDYTEPFLGSAAVFFHLWGQGRLTGDVTLADVNAELVNVYVAVRDQVDDLLGELAILKARHSQLHYYATRAEPFRQGVRGAARTIYLNKTGYNGLYRVNRKGEFNVPMGDYKNPGIYDETVMRRASQALQGARLHCQDFRATIGEANGGWLYVDPPYVPLSPTSSFTAYAPGGFGPVEQKDLAACLRAADLRGLRFVLSNSHTPLVEQHYEGFRFTRVPARRAINSNATRRGPIDEAVVTNLSP